MTHVRKFFMRRPPRPHGVLRSRIVYLTSITLAADVLGTLAMYEFEKGATGGRINVWTDAMFFATVQLLTVSSQMPNPVTGPGRLTDVGLEIIALFVVTGLAGAFASFFFHLGVERNGSG